VQVCNVDFAPLARAATANDGPLALTQMVGVSVTVVPQRRADDLLYRIWCDPSFGPYLKTTLQDIADELNAGAPTA
jgi:sarcosine oxidase subunit gamma